ncbi:MAG: DUF983 domain-containing protein [Dehalococcoidia bacterium]
MSSNSHQQPASGPVTGGQILARGCTNRCPNCGSRSLFAGLLKMRERCPVCGLLFEREEGFFLGAMVFNYVLTALLAVILPAILIVAGRVGPLQTFVFAIATAALLPFLFYRPSKSLWLMTYY